MAQNERLAELSSAGVAVWLDDLSRDRIRSGNLQSLVDEHSVVGVTTNPTIFAAAIHGSESYDDQVHALAVRKVSVEEALRTITATDVRDACDLLRPVADRQPGDGRVSLEVAPGLAHDTDATEAEAAHLWWLVDRPNLYIKIPATQAGLPAISDTIAKGISVNVTLIFSLERYRAVMDAYLTGLEKRVANGGSLEGIASVASFFVSRVDSEIDKRLDKAGADASLKGKAGIANAQLAYQAYEEVFTSDRWRALEAQGAVPQRPLWASTGVKNPEYSDTMYISELIAPGTVNTMPEKTMMAYADHGSPGTPVQKSYDDAAAVRLGWLDLPASSRELVSRLADLRAELTGEGLDRIVLCGMGGSSLAPEVICRTAGVPLVVLDTTDPGQVAAAMTDLERTVVVVSSKSGGTVETEGQRRAFISAFAERGLDEKEVGARFVVVTDPGSSLAETAAAMGARAVFLADPDVGGRYSALSAFGLVPAALAGADVGALLEEAAELAEQLVKPGNAALELGVAMSAGFRTGRDKVTLADGGSAITGFGDWAEQLVAGSTGKDGRGLLPVVVE